MLRERNKPAHQFYLKLNSGKIMFFGSDKVYVDPLFLEGWSKYFRNLNLNARKKFIARVHEFIDDKNFEGREGFEVTDEIKICISAAAVTLTFGLEEYLLPHFHTVIIYPSAFYSKLGKGYHKGETGGGGVIVFSWEHFKEGYANQHDRINLGLHEWAHALMLTGFFDVENRDEHFAQYFNKWRFEAQEEFNNISRYREVFRAYGGTNIEEFFAVCAEVFFEDPELFKQKAPQLFRHFCVLLNQFPLGSRQELLKNITETAEIIAEKEEPLVLEPDKGRIETLILNSFWVIAAIGLGFLTESYGFGIAMAAIMSVNLLSGLRKSGVLNSNTLEISADNISVKNRKNYVLFESAYVDVVNMHISLGDAVQQIYFNVLHEEGIKEQRFTFRYNDEKIDILRKAMQRRKIPLTTNNES